MVLRAYAEALGDGRADEAYALLSDDAKRSISLEAFRTYAPFVSEADTARILGDSLVALLER